MDDVLVTTVFGSDLDKTFKLSEVISKLKLMNLLDVGELAELAISKQSGVDQCDKNTPNIDLVSGKQIKHAQTNPDTSSKYLKAHISIRGITAPILAVITERVSGQQYFFHFPYSSFKHLYGNTFTITFAKDGTPGYSQWWAYEVESFDMLCDLAK